MVADTFFEILKKNRGSNCPVCKQHAIGFYFDSQSEVPPDALPHHLAPLSSAIIPSSAPMGAAPNMSLLLTKKRMNTSDLSGDSGQQTKKVKAALPAAAASSSTSQASDPYPTIPEDDDDTQTCDEESNEMYNPDTEN